MTDLVSLLVVKCRYSGVIFPRFWLCSAVNCLEEFISKTTYDVSSGTLNPTHSPTHSV